MSCAPLAAQDGPRVVVASKADTEGALLGSMIALVLERQGIPVDRKLHFGPTQRVREAILAGEIHIYPEYTGNGAFFHNMPDDPAWKTPETAFQTVRRLDHERHKLVWLPRAPANNTWLIAVRGDVARRRNLITMADFAEAVKRSADLKLAASAEFVESPAALPSFERIYNFHFPRDRIVIQPGGDTMKTMRAAVRNIEGVNAAMVYGTDGAIATFDLVVMKDMKGAQIVYEPAPVIRAEILQRYPKITQALAPVFASLTTAKLQSLNAEIVVEEKTPQDVARRYLDTLGKAAPGPRTSP
ncbi:ABC transporter substrate-binding protein [Microvirga solisilvae]|uniref:ABC transporter substrate-binding protein n=1 Tax=Microvirga solisilvae TaxID=2919498 RepID=UPI001FAFC733|nr:ABC transporter substrate-binding protein [Microvirga solisilvae]